MVENKNYDEIFNEYRKLEAKTSVSVNSLKDGKIEGKNIEPSELSLVDELQEKLKQGLGFLSDEQLNIFSHYNYFAINAVQILNEKKKYVKNAVKVKI